MTETVDLAIRGGTVATPSGIFFADVGVRDGRIAQIGAIAPGVAGEEIDAVWTACFARRDRQPSALPRGRAWSIKKILPRAGMQR